MSETEVIDMQRLTVTLNELPMSIQVGKPKGGAYRWQWLEFGAGYLSRWRSGL